jgi:hypothetical protein
VRQVEWLREATLKSAREHVESEHWQRGEHIELGDMWVPLKGLTGNELRDYQELLRWKLGPPLGVLSLCLTDAKGWIDGPTLEHLVASVGAARRASQIISEQPVGLPTPTVADMSKWYEEEKVGLPARLSDELRHQLESSSYSEEIGMEMHKRPARVEPALSCARVLPAAQEIDRSHLAAGTPRRPSTLLCSRRSSR